MTERWHRRSRQPPIYQSILGQSPRIDKKWAFGIMMIGCYFGEGKPFLLGKPDIVDLSLYIYSISFSVPDRCFGGKRKEKEQNRSQEVFSNPPVPGLLGLHLGFTLGFAGGLCRITFFVSATFFLCD